MPFPARCDGIPVRHVAWQKRLPYLYAQPWRVVAPKPFTLTPLQALRRTESTWAIALRLARFIYIQPAGLRGGRTGNPASVYLIEFVGKNLGLNSAGPEMPQPPTLEFEVAAVNGRTGAAEQLTGGEVHGVIQGGRVPVLWPESKEARQVAEIPRDRYPSMYGLMSPEYLAGVTSLWRDGSVAEYGEVWDPLYVYTADQGGGATLGTLLNYATDLGLIAQYDVSFTCPRKVGRLEITAVHGEVVSLRAASGAKGTFDLKTHAWSFE